jgi:molybdopterin molybdotransferase
MRENLNAGEAQRVVLDQSAPLPPETLSTREALGRVLAEPVLSGRTLPPSDVSAMDGYALRAADVSAAVPAAPVELRVGGEIPAGAAPGGRLGSGEAARILTGAPVPDGADCVVRQEDTERVGDRVRVRVAAPPGENVRRAGEDVRAGELVLEPGVRLGPAQLGLLASLGRTVVAVHQRPIVAILSGGDELVEPDRDAADGRIVSSNSYSIAAQCLELGAHPVYLGIARDRPEELEERLRAGLTAHVLVSSAGVSVGDRDYVRPVLEKLGCEILFWGVRIKPGYPLTFGRFGERGPLVFGLPGNPVSAMVTFEEFARPALRRMAGHRAWFRPRVEARLTHSLRKAPGRMHLVRVRLRREGTELLATSTGNQSSGVLRSMALADGLAVFPAEASQLAEGETVQVQLLDEDFLAAPDSGL